MSVCYQKSIQLTAAGHRRGPHLQKSAKFNAIYESVCSLQPLLTLEWLQHNQWVIVRNDNIA